MCIYVYTYTYIHIHVYDICTYRVNQHGRFVGFVTHELQPPVLESYGKHGLVLALEPLGAVVPLDAGERGGGGRILEAVERQLGDKCADGVIDVNLKEENEHSQDSVKSRQ